MILIGAFGGILRSVFFRKEYSSKRIAILAITGFILTFIFDSLTTLSYPISVGFDFPQTLGIYILRNWFYFVASNIQCNYFSNCYTKSG